MTERCRRGKQEDHPISPSPPREYRLQERGNRLP
jgi:hypothetical protein